MVYIHINLAGPEGLSLDFFGAVGLGSAIAELALAFAPALEPSSVFALELALALRGGALSAEG